MLLNYPDGGPGAGSWPQTYALRTYQQALIQGIYERWHHAPRVLAQLPTGGGKTVIFSAIADEFTRRGDTVLVLAHRAELILQAADKLKAIADCPVGIVKSGHKPDYQAPIQIASVQSLSRRLAHLRPPGLVIIDEAHHTTASSYRKALGAFPTAYVLGLTATPIRTDGSGFEDCFDSLVTGPTVADLIDAGHLSQYRLFADPNPMQTKGARTRQGDYSTGDIADLNPVVELSGNLVASYRQHCPGKRCIVFAVNVEHSQAIVERYNHAGIPAAHLDGETPQEVRAATLAAFARGELLVLSNVNLFVEGFDLPSLDAVQNARPTQSLGLWLQMLGRALRPKPDGSNAVLLDHTKNWAIHGLPTRPRRWSLAGVETEPREARVAPDGQVQEVEEDFGAEILESGGDLVDIALTPEIRWLTTLEQLVETQRDRGYKGAWLWHQLKNLRPPLPVWQAAAQHLGYQKGWAWHQHRQFTLGNSPPPA